MPIIQLRIKGLRGFATEQVIDFAIPDGESGSGLTILVGPNGAGKSTVLEALRAAAQQTSISFTVGSRNAEAGDLVDINWSTDQGAGRLVSVRSGSSETQREGAINTVPGLVHLPSRRNFNPYFGEQVINRATYGGGYGLPTFRAQASDTFSGRLFKIEREGPRDDFNQLVKEIAGVDLQWSIDRQDSGQHFVKVRTKQGTHSSDGLGEGTVSVLFMADALYDSSPGDVIVVDEPELSLHPFHQRRLRAVLSRYARDRQVIVATHSPYFIEWGDLLAGGSIHRIHLDSSGRSVISSARRTTIDALGGVAADIQNPHVLGLNASEVFFLEDGVILGEGQEDVVVYRAMADQLGVELRGIFFGWGVGGAEKMPLVVALLRDLGFEAVLGILDGNRADKAEELGHDYPEYLFEAISTPDVRTKPARGSTAAIDGLADHGGRVLPEHKAEVIRLFERVNEYFDT